MMRVRLAIIDFDSRTACIAVEPGTTRHTVDVRGIVSAIRAGDVQQVEVWIDPALPSQSANALRAVLYQEHIPLRAACPGMFELKGNRVSQLPADPGLPGGTRAWKFAAYFDSLERAVAGSAQLVAWARLTAEVDDGSWARLRFALYELVVNTADHAEFAGNAPAIELRIEATPSSTWLVYRDNARPFTTTSPPEIDIDRKIVRGERRGLGLVMLNRLAQEIRYRRNGAWNETTALFSGSGGMTQSTRSSFMDGFVLDQMPCRVPGTIILKPAGHIDASTVHVVDAKLNALAQQAGVRVVVDMSAVPFVSSAGIGAFLGTVSQLRAGGGDLVFVAMQPAVLEVFEIINLSAYFKIVSSLAELEMVTPR